MAIFDIPLVFRDYQERSQTLPTKSLERLIVGDDAYIVPRGYDKIQRSIPKLPLQNININT
jgi:hypothetical protein